MANGSIERASSRSPAPRAGDGMVSRQIPPLYIQYLDGKHEEIRRRAVARGIDPRVLIGEYWGIFTVEEGLQMPASAMKSLLGRAREIRQSTGLPWKAIAVRIRGRKPIQPKAPQSPSPDCSPKQAVVARIKKKKHRRNRKKREAPREEYRERVSENDVFAHGFRMEGSFQSRV